ncbi:MAG: hypothetical protein M3R02_25310 [Chloroflexota bacterium]|nr:hypothetical protein [Chloroflexota bacterium]
MSDAWNHGNRDTSRRSPLQGGEPQTRGGNQDDRRERSIRVGVSHPSGDPARHRVFEIRASYDEAAGGWVARVGEENANEQLDRWGVALDLSDRTQGFPTPATCLGDAVAALVAAVDGEATGPA